MCVLPSRLDHISSITLFCFFLPFSGRTNASGMKEMENIGESTAGGAVCVCAQCVFFSSQRPFLYLFYFISFYSSSSSSFSIRPPFHLSGFRNPTTTHTDQCVIWWRSITFDFFLLLRFLHSSRHTMKKLCCQSLSFSFGWKKNPVDCLISLSLSFMVLFLLKMKEENSSYLCRRFYLNGPFFSPHLASSSCEPSTLSGRLGKK